MPSEKEQNHIIDVAVIDDDIRVRNGLSSLLNSVPGLRCTGAYHDVSEALLGLSAGAPDILLLDVGLPGTSGLEAITLMRRRFPQMKIIMHSNYDHEEKIARAMQAGALGYVLKNQGVAVLHEAILTVLAGGSVWPVGYDESSLTQNRGRRLNLFGMMIRKCRDLFR